MSNPATHSAQAGTSPEKEEVYIPEDFTDYIPNPILPIQTVHMMRINPHTVDTCKVYDAGWHSICVRET